VSHLPWSTKTKLKMISGGLFLLEMLDYADPYSAFASIMTSETADGMIPAEMMLSMRSYNNSSFGASGGFVLYPNKPNNNMMQQVYRK